ncbi:hypothetical protein [Marichromatium sp. AB32]|nr:hypothetical protein [Marichromatium sp. AB32]
MSEHKSEAQARPDMPGGGQEGAQAWQAEGCDSAAGQGVQGAGVPWSAQGQEPGMGMHPGQQQAPQPAWGAPPPGAAAAQPQGPQTAQGGYGPQAGGQPQWMPGMMPPQQPYPGQPYPGAQPPQYGYQPGGMPPGAMPYQGAPYQGGQPEWAGHGAAPGGYPPGAGAHQGFGAQHGAGAGVAELVDELANGGNGLNSLSKLIDFNDTDFWKGALLGAAAVLVFTNGSVQRTLFGGDKGQGGGEEQKA